MERNKIQLLDARVAAQVAAGEVVQRPSNIIKELLENAVDAGATDIVLRVREAGKESVRVTDNGSGMSEEDALLCFEKHATSKLKTMEDLYSIRTMGFRGEALAAISALCKVQLKTKTEQAASGTCVEYNNGVFVRQYPIAHTTGTDIEVRYLFFTVPARKKFLKNNAIENMHNRKEFLRIALVYPHIGFRFYDEDKIVADFPKVDKWSARIGQVFGKKYKESILPLNEKSDYVHIWGYIGKLDLSKKKRGEQYFFVNDRFIMQHSWHHAILSAYEHLIPLNTHPFYVLNFRIDTSKIDVNVHPSKQEIKFEDEHLLYSFLKAAVRKVLNRYAVSSGMDFSLDPSVQSLPAIQGEQKSEADFVNHPLMRSYEKHNQSYFIDASLTSRGNLSRQEAAAWPSIYEPYRKTLSPSSESPPTSTYEQLQQELWAEKTYFQLHREWIIAEIAGGVIFLHQQRIHQYILYSLFLRRLRSDASIVATPLLFPESLYIGRADQPIFDEMLPILQKMGYHIDFEKQIEDACHYLVSAYPSLLHVQHLTTDIDKLLEAYRYAETLLEDTQEKKTIRCMALKYAIKTGTPLEMEQMRSLCVDFFATEHSLSLPLSPFFILSWEQIEQGLKR